MIILFSFIFLNAKVKNIGVTQFSIKEESSINVILDQPNISSYIFFSDIPPNNTYVSLNEELIYLKDTYMFISDQSNTIHIENPVSFINLTIWIIPSDICSTNARIFKTNQIIFSHWAFTGELKHLCYFPVNNAEAKADITLLSPKKLKDKSNVIIYASDLNNSLYVLNNFTETQKVGPYDKQFFIKLEDAGPGTVFAYDIHFTQVFEDVCIDEPFKYLNQSSNSFKSIFASVDEPSFACSNEIDNNKIVLACFLALALIIIILIVIGLVLLRIYLKQKKEQKDQEKKFN